MFYIDAFPDPKEWVARREDGTEICRGTDFAAVNKAAEALGEVDPILSMEPVRNA